jgi:hypothetical protein
MNAYLVVVHVEIVGRAEDGDKRWEARRLRLSVHAVSGVLSLVRPDDAEQIVVLQEVAACRVTASRLWKSSPIVEKSEKVRDAN